MKTIEYTFIDKSSWPQGLWNEEPDKVQWQDKQTGLPCLAIRNEMGAWCGYVGVGDKHPYFGVEYQKCDVTVHGGLTFSDFCSPHNREHGICHVVEEGESDKVWWLGFDCAHAFDLVPRFFKQFGRTEDVYRSLKYVQSECEILATQLAKI